MGVQFKSTSVICRLQEGLCHRKKELYNILTVFGIQMKLIILIKMCLIESIATFVLVEICVIHFLLRMV